MLGSKNLKEFVKNITVEPATFIYIIAAFLQNPAEMAFVYEKLCMTRFGTKDICNNLHNETFKEEEDMVQGDASKWNMYANMGMSIPPLFMIVIFGTISDKYSRKLCMIIPLFGAALESLGLVILTCNPSLPVTFILVGKIVMGFSGSWPTYFMAMLSYISVITSEENRTTRIAVAESMFSLGVLLSFFVGGLILDNTSYLFIFSTSMILQILAILYIIILVKDIKGTPKSKTNGETVNKSEENCDKNICQKQMAKMADTVRSVFRKRPRNGRVHLLHILPMMVVIMFGGMPVYVLSFLFVKRQPLSWSQSMFGYLNGFNHSLKAISQLVVLPILKKRDYKDPLLMVVGFISAVISQTIFGFSTTTWMVFLAAAGGFLQDFVWTLHRSLLSLLIEAKETGKIFALVGCLQAISDLIGTSFYNTIYPLTLTFWPGFSFVLGAALYAIPIVQIIWVHFDFKKQGTYAYFKEKAAEANYIKVHGQPKESKPGKENGHSYEDKMKPMEYVSTI